MKNKLNLILFIGLFSLALLGGGAYFPLFESALSIDEGFIPMDPSTSALFVVTFLVLFVWVNYTRTFYRYKKSIGLTLLFVALFGVLEIVEYFTGVELTFESYLVPNFGNLNGIPLARMSPVTGFCFFLTSCVLLILLNQDNNSESSDFITQVKTRIKNICITVISFISLLMMVAYLYKSPLFYNTQDIIPMALSTSLGFLSIAGVLIINDKNNYLMKMFTHISPSTSLIRFITPFTVLSVFITGLIQHVIFTVNPVNNSTFYAAFVLTLIAVMCGYMAMFVTKKLMGFQDKNNKNLHQYKAMVTLSLGGQALLDDNFVHLVVNQAYVERLNLTIDQVIGKSVSDVFGKKYFESELKRDCKRCLAGEVIRKKKWIKFPSSHDFYMDIELSPYFLNDGNIYGIMVNSRDITQLKHYQDNLEKYQFVIENSPVIAFRCRPDEHWSV
ncbi:PAS domain S-box protein [Colwellia demingiae]|uniref:PAS domain S-box protein n=1 Tax=Colwellia demingiae TaxID=89401 RepID=A0A5C6QTP0_9GAMM|nr:PAS domain-containing protein [Colwellia demingiae]TWX72020.1 PAS domain S-box protein [Colwellia demingiae]